MKIWKYRIDPPPLGSRISDVVLPQHAALLSVGQQDSQLYVWALVDPSAEPRHYAFKIIGTGREIPVGELDGWTFLGTAHMPVEGLVWHVWVKP